jgi:hypothetical protein
MPVCVDGILRYIFTSFRNLIRGNDVDLFGVMGV